MWQTIAETSGSVLLQIGVWCGALVAILTFLTLFSRLPPVRWLWGQLVSRPLSRWGSGLIREGAASFHEEVVRPQISAIEHKVDELVLQGETSWHKDKAWMVGRVTLLEARYEYLRDRQQRMVDEAAAALAIADDVETVRLALLDAMNGKTPPEPAD